jgi:hypothetical protein
MGYADGMNWYDYVGGDPVNGRDPSGKEVLVVTAQKAAWAVNPVLGATVTAVAVVFAIFNPGVSAKAKAKEAEKKKEQQKEANKQKAQEQRIKPKPGTSVAANICKATSWRNTAILKAIVFGPAQGAASYAYSGYKWYNLVKLRGVWDYKNNPDGTNSPQYEGYGNYNFGATGTALGIPKQVLLRGAGWAQGRSGNGSGEWGSPIGGSPYGDDPLDQISIEKGIDYANANPC